MRETFSLPPSLKVTTSDPANTTTVTCLAATGSANALPNPTFECDAGTTDCVVPTGADGFLFSDCTAGFEVEQDTATYKVCVDCTASDGVESVKGVAKLGDKWTTGTDVWVNCVADPASVKIMEIDWHDKTICGGDVDSQQLVKVTTSDPAKPTTVTCLVSAGSANAHPNPTFDCAAGTTDCVVPAGSDGFDFSDCTAGFEVEHDTATYKVCVDCTASDGVESVEGVAKPGDKWTTGTDVWVNCVAVPDDETTSTELPTTSAGGSVPSTGPPGGSVIARLSVWVMTLSTAVVASIIC